MTTTTKQMNAAARIARLTSDSAVAENYLSSELEKRNASDAPSAVCVEKLLYAIHDAVIDGRQVHDSAVYNALFSALSCMAEAGDVVVVTVCDSRAPRDQTLVYLA